MRSLLTENNCHYLKNTNKKLIKKAFRRGYILRLKASVPKCSRAQLSVPRCLVPICRGPCHLAHASRLMVIGHVGSGHVNLISCSSSTDHGKL